MTQKQIVNIIKTIPDDYMPLFLSDVAITAFNGTYYTANQQLYAVLLKLKAWLTQDEFVRISADSVKAKTIELIKYKSLYNTAQKFQKATHKIETENKLFNAQLIAERYGIDEQIVRNAMKILYEKQQKAHEQPQIHPTRTSHSLIVQDNEYQINAKGLRELLVFISQAFAWRQK